jgi:hypothetical protein
MTGDIQHHSETGAEHWYFDDSGRDGWSVEWNGRAPRRLLIHLARAVDPSVPPRESWTEFLTWPVEWEGRTSNTLAERLLVTRPDSRVIEHDPAPLADLVEAALGWLKSRTN